MRSTRGFSLIEPDHGAGDSGFKGTADSVEKLTDDLIKSVGG